MRDSEMTGALHIAPEGEWALSWQRRRMDALKAHLEATHPKLPKDPAWQTFSELALDFVSESNPTQPREHVRRA